MSNFSGIWGGNSKCEVTFSSLQEHGLWLAVRPRRSLSLISHALLQFRLKPSACCCPRHAAGCVEQRAPKTVGSHSPTLRASISLHHLDLCLSPSLPVWSGPHPCHLETATPTPFYSDEAVNQRVLPPQADQSFFQWEVGT